MNCNFFLSWHLNRWRNSLRMWDLGNSKNFCGTFKLIMKGPKNWNELSKDSNAITLTSCFQCDGKIEIVSVLFGLADIKINQSEWYHEIFNSFGVIQSVPSPKKQSVFYIRKIYLSWYQQNRFELSVLRNFFFSFLIKTNQNEWFTDKIFQNLTDG